MPHITICFLRIILIRVSLTISLLFFLVSFGIFLIPAAENIIFLIILLLFIIFVLNNEFNISLLLNLITFFLNVIISVVVCANVTCLIFISFDQSFLYLYYLGYKVLMELIYLLLVKYIHIMFNERTRREQFVGQFRLPSFFCKLFSYYNFLGIFPRMWK